MIDFNNFDTLCDFVGLDVLRYSLGLQEGQTSDSLFPQQTAALTQLSASARQLSAGYYTKPQGVPFREWLRTALVHSTTNGTATLNHIRNLSLVEYPPIVADDKLSRHLEQFAYYAYPALLIEGRSFTFYDDSHPFFKAFWGDTDLAEALFPEQQNKTPIEVNTSLHFNTGNASGIQLVSIPDRILQYAWELCLVAADSSIERFVLEIPNAVCAFRTLVLGGTVNVPCLLGLQHIKVEEQFRRDFHGVGCLRASTDADTSLFSGPHWSRKRLQYPVVLQREFPLALLDSGFEGDALEMSKFRNRYSSDNERSIAQPFQKLLLSVMLANEGSSPVTIEHMQTCILNPMVPTSSSWKPHGTASGNMVNLIDYDLNDIDHWLSRIKASDINPVRIALRRIFGAVTDRRNAADGFVDIVIACESLFGGNAELSFRISTAMAKLIEPENLVKRSALQKSIKKLYDKRNKIVHGVTEPDHEECFIDRNALCEHLITCLRVIFEHRPELLTDSNRSQTIVLE